MPDGWQESTILIWEKSCPADCSITLRFACFRKRIFEQILDRRIREIVKLSDNQSGFVDGCGTIDAILVAGLPVENASRETKGDTSYLSRLRSRTACGYTVRPRQHGVSEELVEWLRILYSCP